MGLSMCMYHVRLHLLIGMQVIKLIGMEISQ